MAMIQNGPVQWLSKESGRDGAAHCGVWKDGEVLFGTACWGCMVTAARRRRGTACNFDGHA
jgi:hypothetical protein